MHPKKSLGQNFLNSPKALSLLVEAANLRAGETVLEAGPGQGALTRALLSAGAKVVAVEKDRRLIPALQQTFSAEISSGRLAVIEGDILDFAPSSFRLEAKTYKLVANIPYYITGQFLRKFLSADNQPKTMVVLLQKEVAERITARHGAESLLSISVKAYGEPRYIATVKAGSFRPAPKVDSAILAVSNISKKFFADFSEAQFFEILKAGFAHKRKKLSGNLGKKYPNIVSALEKIGLDKNARPENVSLGAWRSIVSSVLSAKSKTS